MLENVRLIPEHRSAVAAVSARIRHFYESKTPFRIYHGSTNSTRKSQYRQDNIVDTSGLNKVLAIDVEEEQAFVQPNVPMDKLVAETLQLGLLPPVVMEFPGITAGGGFSGTSGESSSFKYGFFDRTVKEIELVLGNGEVLVASETGNTDLFHGVASSFGTLGVVTLLRLELVPARSYVALTYIRVHGMEEAISKIKEEQSKTNIDYLDGIMFAKDHGVLCIGKLTDSKPPDSQLQRFARACDPWFYINAEEKSATQERWTEFVPITDYLFRYDRGAFWIGKYTFRYFKVPFNAYTRWALDKHTHTRVMYHALHASDLSSRYIIQDVAIPYRHSPDFLTYLDVNFKQYPIWLCPLRLRGRSESSTDGLQVERRHELNQDHQFPQNAPDMMLNFGIWGPGPSRHSNFVTWNRNLERKVQDLEGRKWLYAHTYYTEEEFWSIYDRESYDRLRRKYHADHLPSLHDKVKVEYRKEEDKIRASWWLWICASFWGIWPLSGVYGWIQCIVSDEYLLPKRELVVMEKDQ